MEELIQIFTSVVKENYANFEGRARRREFWMYQLACAILMTAVNVVFIILAFIAPFLAIIGYILLVIIGLGLLVPSIAVTVRRLHDTNKSGWFILVFLIPFVGQIYLLYLLVTEGDRGANEYGEDPKAEVE